MKIYIMGCTGSGKTYLSRILSKKYNIKNYELDRIVYDQNNLTIHRDDESIEKDFNEIINLESWIIEDIGRERFIEGRNKCDKIYYIKISKFKTFCQMVARWYRQKRNLESYNIKPTFKNLLRQLKDIKLYKKQEEKILGELEKYKDKLEIINDYRRII